MASLVIEQLDRFGPEHCEQLDVQAARDYTRRLVLAQYENFSVISWMLPAELRPHFASVYAFCRWADDLGDEVGDRDRALSLLGWWREELADCYRGKPRHPVFVALRPTVEQFEIPSRPFEDLISAFEQDQHLVRYQRWDQVLDYCTRSADPVGRLVLYMCGYRDAVRQQLSDQTCTALQLANFWQDVRRDILERDRIYLPAESLAVEGLDHDQLVAAVTGSAWDADKASAYARVMAGLVDRTWPLFEKGRTLLPMISPRYRANIQLFTLGGESILKMIHRRGYDTWRHRPSLSGMGKAGLMVKALVGKALACRPWGGQGHA